MRRSSNAGTAICDGDSGIWFFDEHFEADYMEAADRLLRLLKSGEAISTLPSIMPSFIARHDGHTYFFNSFPGTVPFHFTHADGVLWIASKAQYLRQIPIGLELQPPDFIRELHYGREITGSSIFKGVRRLRLGELAVCGMSGDVSYSFPQIERKAWPESAAEETIWIDRLYECLDKHCNPGSESACLTLSGGYDSGSVAGLLAASDAQIHTITTGSKAVNEFHEAEWISETCGHQHHILPIDEGSWLRYYLEAISLNEINHIIIAEAFPGILLSYAEAARYSPVVFTGYGADILLGNLLNAPVADINRMAVRILQRTAVSGELSTAIADHLGVQVRPVYLSREMIDLCLAIPPELKVKTGINKYVQRKMIEKYSLMPEALLQIKKKGLDEGAGIPAVMNRVLGLEEESPEVQMDVRHQFFYTCLREIFVFGKPPGSCDPGQLVHSAKATV